MTIKDDIEKLFRSNYKPMFALAYRLLHDTEAAQDIVHDVFASLLDKNISSVNTTFLMNGVRYGCLKYIRSLSIRERFVKAYSIELNEAEIDSLIDEEQIILINDIIDKKLPQKTRTILRLKYINHLKYKEIANTLSISEVSVYKHLHNAINIIRQNFNNDER